MGIFPPRDATQRKCVFCKSFSSTFFNIRYFRQYIFLLSYFIYILCLVWGVIYCLKKVAFRLFFTNRNWQRIIWKSFFSVNCEPINWRRTDQMLLNHKINEEILALDKLLSSSLFSPSIIAFIFLPLIKKNTQQIKCQKHARNWRNGSCQVYSKDRRKMREAETSEIWIGN